MKKKKLEWQRAVCPVCGREYEYLPDYKPKTCGNHDCIKRAKFELGIL